MPTFLCIFFTIIFHLVSKHIPSQFKHFQSESTRTRFYHQNGGFSLRSHSQLCKHFNSYPVEGGSSLDFLMTAHSRSWSCITEPAGSLHTMDAWLWSDHYMHVSQWTLNASLFESFCSSLLAGASILLCTSRNFALTYSQSFYAVPAAWALSIAPHFYAGKQYQCARMTYAESRMQHPLPARVSTTATHAHSSTA